MARFDNDKIIGLIEDTIINEEFRLIQQIFLKKYVHEFDPELNENKLIYMDIYQEYLNIIETFLLNKIKIIQPDFNLHLFIKYLQNRENEFDKDIFEFLLSLTDFCIFKQWMFDHRQSILLYDLNIIGIKIKQSEN